MVFPWFGVAPFKRLKGDDQPPGGLRLQDLRGAVEPGDPADAGRGGSIRGFTVPFKRLKGATPNHGKTMGNPKWLVYKGKSMKIPSTNMDDLGVTLFVWKTSNGDLTGDSMNLNGI